MLAGLGLLAQGRLPVLDGVVSFTELSRGAAVKFDERQVPYIEAASEPDMYRVQGYMTAADRLFQMDISRRTALGELSEVFGAQALTHDKLLRTIGINRVCQEELKTLPREAVNVLDAYCQGVNAFISTNKDRLPFEFFLLGYSPKPWTPLDTLAILKYSQYEQDETWRLDDLRQRVLDKCGDKIATVLFDRTFAPPVVGMSGDKARIFPPHPLNCSESLPTALAPSPLWGSNGWVLSGAGTETKGAVLAIDKHHGFSEPVDWYLLSMRCPTLHLAGATIPGVPGVLNGRNEKIGFGLLALKVDVQDLFLEQFSPQFPGKYKTPQGWDTAKEVVEEIPVRFSDKLFFSSNLVHRVLTTRHGPVLVKGDENAVALSWVGLNPVPKVASGYFEAINALNRAKTFPDFQKALSRYQGSPLTALYVDSAGQAGYQQAGLIPQRASGSPSGRYEGCLLNPGFTGGADWVSYLPFKDMDNAINPPKGYFVANFQETRPDMPLGNNLLRAQRAISVLEGYKSAGQKPGLPEMAVLQGDNAAPYASLVKQVLHENVAKSESIDTYQIAALEQIDRWDGNLSESSSGAAIYESFIRTVVRRVLSPKLGSMTNEYLERYPSWPLMVGKILKEHRLDWLPPEERTFKNFVATSFSQAIKDLRLATKSDECSKWRWGDLHQAKFEHLALKIVPQLSFLSSLVDVSAVRLSGDQDTVNTTESSLARGKEQFLCQSGSTMRLLLDASDNEKFYQTLILGQSGHMLSPARMDQLKSWLSQKPMPLALSPQAEAKICQHRLLFTVQ